MPINSTTRALLALALQTASEGKYVVIAHRQCIQTSHVPVVKRTKWPKLKKAKQKKRHTIKLSLAEDLARSHNKKQALLKTKPSRDELERRKKTARELAKPRWMREQEEHHEGSVWHTYTPFGGDPRYKIGRRYI